MGSQLGACYLDIQKQGTRGVKIVGMGIKKQISSVLVRGGLSGAIALFNL